MNSIFDGVGAVAFALTAATAFGQTEPIDSASILRIGEQAFAEHTPPGAVVAVVQGDSISLLTGFGVSDIKSGRPVDPERTVFEIASVSKTVTATAIMRLVERGAIGLEADINNSLKSVKVPATFAAPVTLEHLLTHTAGFSDRFIGYVSRSADERPSLAGYLADRLPPRFIEPGRVIGYSNHGVGLAGLAAAEVAGVGFEELVEREVFEPLGMAHSTFRQPLPSALTSDAATGYTQRSADISEAPVAFRNCTPAGGMSTTGGDMVKFMMAHLGVGEKAAYLKRETLGLMHSRHFGPVEGMPGVCLGFFEMPVGSERAVAHPGQTVGFSAALVLIPERRFGLFVCANSNRTAFCGAFVRGVLRAAFPATIEAPAGSAAPPSEVAGAYRSFRSGFGTIENLAGLFGGQAIVEVDGPSVYLNGNEYRSAGGSVFREVDGTKSIAFHDGALLAQSEVCGVPVASMFAKLPAISSPRFINEFFLSWLMLLLATGVVWAVVVVALRLISNVKGTRSSLTADAVVAALLCAALACSTVGFGFVFIRKLVHAASSGGGDVIFGLPTSLKIALWLPFTTIALLVILAGVTLRAGRRWPLAVRVYSWLMWLAGAVWIGFLFHFDLVGLSS